MSKFFRIKERNSWERETWNFYIPAQGNRRQIKMLARKVKEAGLENVICISMEEMEESEVDDIVKNQLDVTGYMWQHNKCKGKMNSELIKSTKANEMDVHNELFYKGPKRGLGLVTLTRVISD
jgi:hypothetical protein